MVYPNEVWQIFGVAGIRACLRNSKGKTNVEFIGAGTIDNKFVPFNKRISDSNNLDPLNVTQCESWCFKNGPSDPDGLVDDRGDKLCDHRNAGSTRWPRTIKKGSLFTHKKSVNPIFHNAQKIQISSCSGDAWMGNNEVPRSTTNPLVLPTIFFHGQKIIDEVFEFLSNTGINCDEHQENCKKITSNSRVLFGGESRGAHGAWGNIDRVCEKLKLKGTECLGITASFFPGINLPRLTSDLTTPIPDTTWFDQVTRTKARYRYQGITIDPQCAAVFSGGSPISTINPYEIDPSGRSRDFCYTQLALLSFIDTPSFISMNRLDGSDEQDWFAGCSSGLTSCINNPNLRELDFKNISAMLPDTFSVYLTKARRHLYTIVVDGKCIEPIEKGYWFNSNIVFVMYDSKILVTLNANLF